MPTYFDQLCAAMEMVARNERAIFLGQAVEAKGTGMSASFANVPRHQLLELPVFEGTQMGLSIGLALDGWLPISVYPRFNFLICAMDQLVNHLDKIPLYSGFRPRVIVRVGVPTAVPLDPGPQHLGDFSEAFRLMFKTVKIVELSETGKIIPSYREAMGYDGSTILVEYTERYSEIL